MIGIFQRLARRTAAPPRPLARAPARGSPRSFRLEVEVLEQRALPGNVLLGALLLPPGLDASLGLDDADSAPAQRGAAAWGPDGSVSPAAAASPGVLSGTDLDSLGGAAPTPIPETRTNSFGGPAIHFNKPGLPTDPPPIGNEPSTIDNFNGFIGVADLQGTGTDGSGNTLSWAADVRFMTGIYQGVDGELHSGTFAFV
jgi:hypothetical protein